jgi:regulator of sigma E protease
MTVIIGIICLGVLVFVHELGHFAAARLCGVAVETFSIGMGPVLLHKAWKGTDYRLSLVPLGGYCGMKGEKDYQKALDENLTEIPKTPDSFYGVHPLKRAVIACCGPLANVLFAVLAFMIIAMAGYTYYSADNRVILADEIYEDIHSPAREAGLQTGDRIVAINGIPTPVFMDISREVSSRPNEALTLVVDRAGQARTVTLVTAQDPETLAGKIGVVNWVDPVIESVAEGGVAAAAGLRGGDLVIAIDGREIKNLAELQKNLGEKKAAGEPAARLAYIRTPPGCGNTTAEELRTMGTEYETTLPMGDEPLGITFSMGAYQSKTYSLFPAIVQGAKETWNVFALSVKSLGMLFKGANLTKAVSGPVRITVMLGDTVKAGFSENFNAGLAGTLNFMALISVSLFIMNLLPIPILDGGLVLFALIEFVRRRQVRPKILYYVQFVGIAFIVLLFAVALFSDIGYLRSR